jgi:flavin reductase (DIM6/NTAB) family NADH-FMN oxidoreductase RutF
VTLDPLPDVVTGDTPAYRRALGAFATGVCVVTAHSEAGPLGITINSFTSVSLEPRLILWCLDEQSERWSAFAAADRFAVHVLTAADRARADRFARGVWTLEPSDFVEQPGHAPRLEGVLARLECTTHARIPMGDHLILVGQVEAFEVEEGDALTYYRGRYGRIGDAR